MGRTEKIWEITLKNESLATIISRQLGIMPVTAQILLNRGLSTVDDARVFLYGDLRFLHDPFLLKDMDRAVERIELALARKENIMVYGDYDADGVTSTALLVKFFRSRGVHVDYYIPHRTEEGYGLHKKALENIAAQGFSLVVTVDCGISGAEEAEYASSLGLDLIVTDHHEAPKTLPRALAVVNPKKEDCRYPFRELAGVGVAFKLVQAILIREEGLQPAEAGLAYLDLVTLGTIADVVPLLGENRLFVQYGLKLLENSPSPGFRALLEVAGWQGGEVTSRMVAFGLAPRINAGGRVAEARPAVELLLTEDPLKAQAIAAELHRANEERQKTEAAILQEALEKVELEVDPETQKTIVVAAAGWHPGVLGIVASRLVERFYRPVIVLSIEDGEAKGSARSIPAFHLYEALKHCEKYLMHYGGHRQAAGLTLPVDNLSSFREELEKYAQAHLQEEDLVPRVVLDSEVSFGDLTEALWQELTLLAPYGAANPGPLLACRNAEIKRSRPVGNGKHLQLSLAGERLIFNAICFNMGNLHGELPSGKCCDLAFALEKNEWQGRSTLQLRVEDIKAPGPEDLAKLSNLEGSAFIDDLFARATEFLGDDFYRNIGEREEFFTKVAGVSFEGRQEVIAALKEGEELRLLRDRDNPHDPNAVQVVTGDGVQVGFLNRRLAKHFAPLLDAGQHYRVLATSVTGGGDRHYGLNVLIQKNDTGDDTGGDMAEARRHLSELGDSELKETIREMLLGPHPYRPKQQEALDSLFAGHDTLAVFGTGRGKSALFQTMAAWQALRENKISVIIYPLRALVNDQYEAMLGKLSPAGLRVFKANGSLGAADRARLFAALEAAETDILLTTPEFIEYHWEKFVALREKIGFFVVDECHHIAESSLSNRPAYRRLGRIIDGLGKPLVLAVTATADDEAARAIVGELGIDKVIVDPHVRSNLQVVDRRDCRDKKEYLQQVVETGAKTVIYVNSRVQAVEIATLLREALATLKDKIAYYHAGLSNKQREMIEKMFRDGEISCVVATSAFGEGIDIPDIAHVALFHLNFSFTEFNQLSGRAGRDGKTAQVHLLFGERDASINNFILDGQAPDRELLAKLYFLLKQLGQKENPLTVTNGDLAEALKKLGLKDVRENTVSTSLGILEELDLIQREREGAERYIYLMPSPGEKIELEQSLRYLEGIEEKRAFEEFRKEVFASGTEGLLAQINRPIYPAGYLKDDDHAVDHRQADNASNKL